MGFDWDGFRRDWFPKNASWDEISRFGKQLTGPGFYNYVYDHSHGGTRYWLSQVPIYGWLRRISDDARRAQEYYDITGEDPRYMSRYGSSAGAPTGALGGANQILRMSRSLASLYPAEVKEDLAYAWRDAWRMKRDSYNASERAANAWNNAWSNKR